MDAYIMDQENERHTQKIVEWENERSNIRRCLTSPELSSSRFYMRNKLLYILATPSVVHSSQQHHPRLERLSELQIFCPTQTN